jgi:small-conductance mechanosensitive channel
MNPYSLPEIHFEINDAVQWGDYYGKVKKVNLKTLEILTLDGYIVTIDRRLVISR